MSLIRPFRVISLGILVWTMIEAACIRSGLTRQLLPSSVPAGSGRLYIASKPLEQWSNPEEQLHTCCPGPRKKAQNSTGSHQDSRKWRPGPLERRAKGFRCPAGQTWRLNADHTGPDDALG